MGIEVRPANVFDDVKTMLGPKRADANVCWCLSYRIPAKDAAGSTLSFDRAGDFAKQSETTGRCH